MTILVVSMLGVAILAISTKKPERRLSSSGYNPCQSRVWP